MNKKLYWSLGLGVLGLLLAQKHTYWFSGTYLHDIKTSALGGFAGILMGFLLGCVVERTASERKSRLKVLYWLLVMAILGSYLGFGRSVPIGMTLTVMACTLGLGLVIGLLQYFLQSRKATR